MTLITDSDGAFDYFSTALKSIVPAEANALLAKRKPPTFDQRLRELSRKANGVGSKIVALERELAQSGQVGAPRSLLPVWILGGLIFAIFGLFVAQSLRPEG